MGTSSNVGGLVGSNNEGTISSSYSRGIVTGTRFVGGLVGENELGTIIVSWSSGSVTSENNGGTGGLVGSNSDDGSTSTTINASWSSGVVIHMGTDTGGGLVGSSNGMIANSYWDTNTSMLDMGIDNDVSSTITAPFLGLTTNQMRAQPGSGGTFPDFSGSFSDVWQYTPGCYPRLREWVDANGNSMIDAGELNTNKLLPEQGDPTDSSGVCSP